MKTTGEEVRKRRLKLKWSRSKLARRADVATATVAAIEDDPAREPFEQTVAKIVEALEEGERCSMS